MSGIVDERGESISRATVILNANKPRAAAERACAVLRQCGMSTQIVVTRNAEHGREAARDAIAQGAQWIVAAGGDGTVMSVLEPVVESGVTLVLVPLGTANDFSSYLQMRDQDAALGAMKNGVTTRIDVSRAHYVDARGSAQHGLFCSSAGLGVMARLAELEETNAAAWGKRVLGNGVWPLLAASATLTVKFSRARVTVDDATMERDVVAFEVSKVPAVGGFVVTPDASADSGMLHAWIAEGTTRRELVHTLRCALASNGTLLKSRHLQYISRDPATNVLRKSHAKQLAVECEPAQPVHLNGDYVGTTPARFEVLDKALRVRLPLTHALASRAQ